MSEVEAITIRARGLTFPALAAGAGPLVLCLHGFPDHLRSFRHQLEPFAKGGYRAVAPALRGYHPGAMPALEACNVVEAAKDAVALVHALGHERAHLVGHDWGAAAAYIAAAWSPSTWHSVTTLAVPHPLGMVSNLHRLPRQLQLSWYMLFFQLPHLAERRVKADDFAFLQRLWRDWSPGFSLPSAEMRALKDTFAQPGVVSGALSYYRQMFALNGASAREGRDLLLRRLEPPVLALTGAEDGCIDTRMYDLAMTGRWFSYVNVERMQGVGHFLHQEDPIRVSQRILSWIQQHSEVAT